MPQDRASQVALANLLRYPEQRQPSVAKAAKAFPKDEIDQIVQFWKEEDAAMGKPVLEDYQYGYAATDLLQGEDFGSDGRERLKRFRSWQKKNGLRPSPHVRLT